MTRWNTASPSASVRAWVRLATGRQGRRCSGVPVPHLHRACCTRPHVSTDDASSGRPPVVRGPLSPRFRLATRHRCFRDDLTLVGFEASAPSGFACGLPLASLLPSRGRIRQVARVARHVGVVRTRRRTRQAQRAMSSVGKCGSGDGLDCRHSADRGARASAGGGLEGARAVEGTASG